MIIIEKVESSEKQNKNGVPIWEKSNLTVEEYSAYSGIGINKIKELSNSEKCPFVLWVGKKRLIKRKLCDRYIENQYYYEHSIKDSKLGKMKVANIRKSDILLFYKKCSDSGYSAGTIKIIQKIIRPALQLACDDNIILKNPADGCTKDYPTKLEKKYALTFDEEKEFLERIQNRPRMKRYYPMFAIMLKTGLRISEVIGLTWDDVNMDEKEISINHQVQCRTVDGKYILYASETKANAGTRVIPMIDEVYKLFLEQRKVWFVTTKATDFEVDGHKNFVFVSHVTGKCMNHNNVRRMLKSIVSMNNDRDIQLPHISPHILRHTAATRLAESGCDIKVMQYLLGQTDIQTTMRVYNHVDVGRVKRELEKLEKLQVKMS
ncbi:MAG: tyrosine-type recombinase/integrase [Lachnospiraceae bacterium]|nr:tyrosine-type recombinase/integrase [Lachnospiraceae bacterium]